MSARTAVDRAVQQLGGGLVGGRVDDVQLPGLLVDDVAPQPLQEAEHADDIAGLPWPGGIQRTHRHQVQTERVGAVAVVDLLRRHGVLEALAHLAPVPGDGTAVVARSAVGVGDHVVSRHVDAPLVLVGGGEHVALVEQAGERLRRRQVAEVEQDLVPEAGVQQMEDGVLDAADVQIDPTGMVGTQVGARAHPVALGGRIDEHVVVVRVAVAQLVPARSGPLRHHVGVAAIGLFAVTQVERHLHPVGDPIERALRLGELVVGIERARRELIGVGQRQRQHLVGQDVGITGGVVDDRDRLAPVALPGEQPVTQLVGDRRLAEAAGLQPLVDRGDPIGDRRRGRRATARGSTS